MKLIRLLGHLWKTPSAFRDDWRKYARNQLGHGILIGFLPGLLLGPVGLTIGLAMYAVWELSQWQWRRASASDCVEDFAFVACGGFLGLTGSIGYLWLMLAFVSAGILWRLEEAD